jgi:hypothetical protein
MKKVLVCFIVASIVAFSSPVLAYETQISGEFHGWDGSSIYELIDGTVIKQSNYHYHYHYAYSPEVILYECNGFTCKIHVKDDDDDEEVTVQILSGGGSRYVPTPQFVPTPAPAPAPVPEPQPNGSVSHATWYMTCTSSNGSTYEVSWHSKPQTLTVRATGKTFVATYGGYATQISPSAFSVVATGYGRTLRVIFEGPSSSLHADKNGDGAPGATDKCAVTGGSD